MAAPVARQTYTISEFDTVRLEAPVQVILATGRGVSASGTGDRDTLDGLVLDVSGRVLTIRNRQVMTLGGSGGKARAPTILTLTTGDLRRASVLGSGSMSVDRLKGAQTDARVQGSGTLTVAALATDRLDVGLTGAGSMTLSGAVPDMTVAVSGSGRLDAAALRVERLRIDAEGSGDVQAQAVRQASASANGTGRIVVTGKPQCTVHKMGNASITCGGAVY